MRAVSNRRGVQDLNQHAEAERDLRGTEEKLDFSEMDKPPGSRVMTLSTAARHSASCWTAGVPPMWRKPYEADEDLPQSLS